jgi:hypothetical protein
MFKNFTFLREKLSVKFSNVFLGNLEIILGHWNYGNDRSRISSLKRKRDGEVRGAGTSRDLPISRVSFSKRPFTEINMHDISSNISISPN